jgi:hypothetical protein
MFVKHGSKIGTQYARRTIISVYFVDFPLFTPPYSPRPLSSFARKTGRKNAQDVKRKRKEGDAF